MAPAEHSRKEDTCTRGERAGTQKRRALYGEASVVLITILTSGRTNVYVYTKGVDRVYVRIKYT